MEYYTAQRKKECLSHVSYMKCCSGRKKEITNLYSQEPLSNRGKEWLDRVISSKPPWAPYNDPLFCMWRKSG